MSTPQEDEDAAVEADTRVLLDAYYRSLIGSGVSEDEALTLTAAKHKELRDEWRAAKEADGV